LLILAADALPEVRASAARALAKVRPEVSFPVLSTLAVDAEWFVRLRAVIALSSLDHPERFMCCCARCVIRTATSGSGPRGRWPACTREKKNILEKVVATKDNYALQAFLSELERCGLFGRGIGSIGKSSIALPEAPTSRMSPPSCENISRRPAKLRCRQKLRGKT
jgi:hypothetical protein